MTGVTTGCEMAADRPIFGSLLFSCKISKIPRSSISGYGFTLLAHFSAYQYDPSNAFGGNGRRVNPPSGGLFQEARATTTGLHKSPHSHRPLQTQESWSECITHLDRFCADRLWVELPHHPSPHHTPSSWTVALGSSLFSRREVRHRGTLMRSGGPGPSDPINLPPGPVYPCDDDNAM